MDRRTFLATGGALTAGFAGCLQDGGTGTDASTDSPTTSESDAATDETATAIPPENDGYPDASVVEDPPDPVDADVSSFETLSVSGIEVPLVPVQIAYNWFQRREARFVDARGSTQYRHTRIPGAIHSPAPTGKQGDDPIALWPDGARIVVYCGCPHHLSSQRAANLIEGGREEVYAIDEGFRRKGGGWLDRGYPTVGSGKSTRAYVVRGETDPADAGKYAWAEHKNGAQLESAPITEDGSYEMTLHFSGLTAQSLVTVRTPSYVVVKPLIQVTTGVVTGK